eukprot:Skav214783  [mRNA]  locus=scaffold1820:27552:29378:- [translate_table: standard]
MSLPSHESGHEEFRVSLEDIHREIKELRAGQLQRNEQMDQLLAGVQLLIDFVRLRPVRPPTNKMGKSDVELEIETPTSSKNLHPAEGVLKSAEVHGVQSAQSQSAQTPKKAKKVRRESDVSADSHRSMFDFKRGISGSAGVGSSNIPELCDLEKEMLRQASSSSHLQPASFGRPAFGSKASRVQDEAAASAPPAQLESVVTLPQSEPPNLQVSKAHTGSGPLMTRRGSRLHSLTRESQAHILSLSSARESVCNIFVEQIGVSLWLKWSNLTSFAIVLMCLCYLVLSVICIWGSQASSQQWTALSLLVFSTVAVLLLQLVKRSLRSPDLNMAVQKLDLFVQNCGKGLDWDSIAARYWYRFLALWLVVVVAFMVQQVLEAWMTHASAHADGLAHSYGLELSGNHLLNLKAIVGVILFAVSSAVVMDGAYFQFNLLLGLGKTLDCWCADILQSPDFNSGRESWNALQALLRCVGREITPCFTALNLLGYVGFIAALAGCFTLLLDDVEGAVLFLSEFALLPLVYLFYLSARLFAKGASLSEKCHQIPAFVNQLPGEGADADRQYLVQYISASAAGFIVHGVSLSQSQFLKQMHFLTAVFSGFAGILLRRYL